MNVFIDTPQRAAERLDWERRNAASSPSGEVSATSSGQGSAERADRGSDAAPRAARSGRAPRRAARETSRREAPQREVPAPQDAAYSVAEEAYRAEKAYDRKRARRRKALAIARVLAAVVLLPVAVVAVFLVSYGLTCVLNGASPDELVQLFAELFARIEGFARDLLASW